jgi:drug/metabolite transporter (DMT)-like permease
MTVLAMSTYGIQLIFYGSLFLGYHVNKKNIVCLVLILCGVSFVVPSWNFNNNLTMGFCLALVSASFYAIIPIMLQKSQEFNLETRIFAQFTTAFVGYSVLFPLSHWMVLTKVDWLGLLFLAVLGTFIAHSLWSRVVASVPTTTSGIVYYIITPSAMFLSWFLLGDMLSGRQLIGGAVILVAALLNTLSQERINKMIKYNFKKFL